MKRFLSFVFGVVVVSLTLFCVNEMLNIELCRRSDVGDERMEKARKIEHLFKNLSKEEIPIIGSSRAGAYVPSVISERCCGYSFSGCRLKETLFLLGKILSVREEGLVIVNIDPWGAMGYDEPFVAIYDLVDDDADVRENVSNSSARTGFIASKFPFAFRFKRNLQNFIQARKRKTQNRVQKKSSAGVSDVEWAKMDATVKPWYFEKCDESIMQLKTVLENQRKNKIAWVVQPIEPHKRKLMKNPEAIMEYLGVAAARQGNYIFDFFTEETAFARADFADPNHLNHDGERKFSAFLRDAMLDKGLLPMK